MDNFLMKQISVILMSLNNFTESPDQSPFLSQAITTEINKKMAATIHVDQGRLSGHFDQ